jgi:hypothetical protein
MKKVVLAVLVLGLLFAAAAPSLAHDHWAGHGRYYGPAYHHGYWGPQYYGGYRPIVVVPTAPVYGYRVYPPAIGPVYSTPVVPYPYYATPGVTLGFRGPRISVGVGF